MHFGRTVNGGLVNGGLVKLTLSGYVHTPIALSDVVAKRAACFLASLEQIMFTLRATCGNVNSSDLPTLCLGGAQATRFCQSWQQPHGCLGPMTPQLTQISEYAIYRLRNESIDSVSIYRLSIDSKLNL